MIITFYYDMKEFGRLCDFLLMRCEKLRTDGVLRMEGDNKEYTMKLYLDPIFRPYIAIALCKHGKEVLRINIWSGRIWVMPRYTLKKRS